jgi:hypothetical protein
MLAALDKYHGQATGIFTCDEHLAGRNPSQGTELCTVVEAMYSLEVLSSILGRVDLADRLERLAFNALPATFKPDMCAHQYDQQANQVVCKVSEERVYTNNNPDSNIFGLEPNFGCCTANMHQGWPKFAANLWMRTPGDGLVALAYAPAVLETKVNGRPVRIRVETSYPFDDSIQLTVEAKERVRFPLRLRIPWWAAQSVLKGDNTGQMTAAAGTFMNLDREWTGTSRVLLRLPMPVTLWAGYGNSVSIVRGPLTFALPVGGEWKKIGGREPFADWEVYPATNWNYGLRVDRQHPERSVRFESQPVGDRPFSPEGAPIIAYVNGRKLPSWGMNRNAAAPPPESPVRSNEPLERLKLVPYGCTSLRVTEFPTLAE